MRTSILETHHKAWPCGGKGSDYTLTDAERAVNVQETAACEDKLASGHIGRMTHAESGQCTCMWSRTVYPIGVDDMTVQFEHTYSFPDGRYQGHTHGALPHRAPAT